MICKGFKKHGINMLDKVKFDGEICDVVGFDLSDNFVLITYRQGWQRTFTNKSMEVQNEHVVIHPNFLHKYNRYYWVRAKYLKIAYSYDNIIEI